MFDDEFAKFGVINLFKVSMSFKLFLCFSHTHMLSFSLSLSISRSTLSISFMAGGNGRILTRHQTLDNSLAYQYTWQRIVHTYEFMIERIDF